MFYYNDSQSHTNYHDDGHSHMHDNASERDDGSFSLLKQPYDPSTSLSQSQMSQPFVGSESLYIPHDFDTTQDSFLNDIFFSSAGLEDLTASNWDGLQQQHNKSLFPSLNNNGDGASETKHQQQQQQQQQHQGTPIPDTFLSLDDQQAILLSDPSFVRQQRLLQEHQKRCEEGSGSTQQEEFRSNLTTMLDSPDVTADNHNVTSFASQTPSLDSLSADSRMNFGNTPTPSSSSSAVAAAAKKKQSAKSAKPAKAQQQTRSAKRTSPIPIDGKTSSEIDHQRRRNELQARFRVSYARKPGAPTNSSSISVMASSFSGVPKIKQSLAEYLGTSLPNITSVSNSSSGGRDDGKNASEDKGSKKNPTVSNMPSFPSRTMPIQIQRVQRPNTSQPMDAEQHQRWLDEQLEKVDFDDITVSELKDMLRQRGKPATGKKAVLVQRLQEEREHLKAVRSGRAQRHSQPPPSSHTSNMFDHPRSYQGSSPLLPPYTGSGGSLPPSSPLPIGSPSSLPNSSSMYIPGSPNSVSSYLNRSINNLHIGSPPASSYHARRYSPYATPGSPRIASSPKSPAQRHSYSSSLPNDGIPSFPGSGSPLSSSFSSRFRPTYHNSYNRPKSYAPFTSSALATPDRDDDRDPFDDLAEDMQQEMTDSNNNNNNNGLYSIMDSTRDKVIIDDQMQQDFRSMYGLDIPGGFSQDDLFALLAGQGPNSSNSSSHAFTANTSSFPQDTQQGNNNNDGFEFTNMALFGGQNTGADSSHHYPPNANGAFWS